MNGFLVVIALGGLSLFGLVLGARWLEARAWRRSLVAYRLSLPLGLTADDVAAWLGHVAAGTHAPRVRLIGPPATALEVTATSHGIGHVLLVPRSTSSAVLSGLRAAMPGVRVTEDDEYLSRRPPKDG